MSIPEYRIGNRGEIIIGSQGDAVQLFAKTLNPYWILERIPEPPKPDTVTVRRWLVNDHEGNGFYSSDKQPDHAIAEVEPITLKVLRTL